MKNDSSPKGVAFITLGCAKNEVDTSHMSKRLVDAGYVLIDDISQADAIIINTCSFIQAATEESIEAILDTADLASVKSGSAKLIVAGCMPARYGDELLDELPEAKAFVPCSKEDDIVEVLNDIFGNQTIILDHSSSSQSASSKEAFAYVKISDGCDRFCSFCTIPYIRGRYHSFTLDDIASEVEQLVYQGVKEIVLIAQDTGRWGSDFENPSTLAYLLDTLAQRFVDTWFRVMYIQPEGVSPQLLDVIDSHDNICTYLDIPLQHVDNEILASMNRKGSLDEFRELLAMIRSTLTDVTLRTTLIAGFPGESDEAFEALCDFVEEAEFDYVGVFPYSREEGTRAARLENQIDEDTKLERAQTLRDLADTISTARVALRIGKYYDVLVLGYEQDGQLYGRASCQAPDVDGVTYLSSGEVGSFCRVLIEDTLLYEMEGI